MLLKNKGEVIFNNENTDIMQFLYTICCSVSG